MKKTLKVNIVFLILLGSLSLYSQDIEQTGTLLLTNNDTLKGTVNLMLEANSFNVELIQKSKSKIYSPSQISTLILDDGTVYISETIAINKKEIRVFLECHIAGIISFYSFVDRELRERFFIKNDVGVVRELKYDRFIKNDSEVGKHLVTKKLYIGELIYALSKCTNPNLKEMISNLNLSKNNIIEVITRYHNCTNEEFQIFKVSRTKSIVNAEFEISGGFSSVKVDNINPIFDDSKRLRGNSYSIVFNCFIPRTHQRYSVNVGGMFSFFSSQTGEKVSFVSVPIVLSRYSQLSRNHKTYLRLGLDRIFSQRFGGTEILVGGGYEYSIRKGKFKIFNTIDYRLIHYKRLNYNLGLRFKI